MSKDWLRRMSEAKQGRSATAETKLKMGATKRAAGLTKNLPAVIAINNMMCAGFTRNEIASVLFISPGRVKQLRKTYGKGITIEHQPE